MAVEQPAERAQQLPGRDLPEEGRVQGPTVENGRLRIGRGNIENKQKMFWFMGRASPTVGSTLQAPEPPQPAAGKKDDRRGRVPGQLLAWAPFPPGTGCRRHPQSLAPERRGDEVSLALRQSGMLRLPNQCIRVRAGSKWSALECAGNDSWDPDFTCNKMGRPP